MDEMTFKEYLEIIPPGKKVYISDFHHYDNGIRLNSPTIQLYCPSKECEGIRFYTSSSNNVLIDNERYNHNYLHYVCRNCRKEVKTYALRSFYNSELKKWEVMKYGEVPAFGPPTPARAYNLIGGERELFLLGRRNEIQGMGIGAFVYYRRVIESQKTRIFDEVIRVISKISPADSVIKELEEAKKETQFTKAVESIKHALPQALYINGFNPLTLLHSALSEGVHNHTDNECLELASDVRTVLFEFAERLGQALKEEAELNNAVNRLAKKKSS